MIFLLTLFQDAQAALTRHNSFETFTISSKPVLASYIHAGVFVPVLNPTASTERFTFSPLGNPSVKLAYWDEDAYATELKVSDTPNNGHPKLRNDRGSSSTTAEKVTKQGKESDKAKKRKADNNASTGTKKLAMPSHLQFWSNRHAELHGIERNNADDGSGSSEKAMSEATIPGEGGASPSAGPAGRR